MTQNEDFAKSIAFGWWPIFKMISFLEDLVFFERFFAQNNCKWFVEQILTCFFGILIFDPKWGFYKAYAWWPFMRVVADFQNGVISRIFSVFSIGVSHWTTGNVCRTDFDMFFGILIFDPKLGFCKVYSLCMMADFQNGLISRILSVFSIVFFAPNNCKWFVEWMLTCFLEL